MGLWAMGDSNKTPGNIFIRVGDGRIDITRDEAMTFAKNLYGFLRTAPTPKEERTKD